MRRLSFLGSLIFAFLIFAPTLSWTSTDQRQLFDLKVIQDLVIEAKRITELHLQNGTTYSKKLSEVPFRDSTNSLRRRLKQVLLSMPISQQTLILSFPSHAQERLDFARQYGQPLLQQLALELAAAGARGAANSRLKEKEEPCTLLTQAMALSPLLLTESALTDVEGLLAINYTSFGLEPERSPALLAHLDINSKDFSTVCEGKALGVFIPHSFGLQCGLPLFSGDGSSPDFQIKKSKSRSSLAIYKSVPSNEIIDEWALRANEGAK